MNMTWRSPVRRRVLISTRIDGGWICRPCQRRFTSSGKNIFLSLIQVINFFFFKFYQSYGSKPWFTGAMRRPRKRKPQRTSSARRVQKSVAVCRRRIRGTSSKSKVPFRNHIGHFPSDSSAAWLNISLCKIRAIYMRAVMGRGWG